MTDREIAMVLMYQAFDMDWIGLDDENREELDCLTADIKNAGVSLRNILDRITEPDLDDAIQFWKDHGGDQDEE